MRRGGGKTTSPALKQNKHFNHGKRAAARPCKYLSDTRTRTQLDDDNNTEPNAAAH